METPLLSGVNKEDMKEKHLDVKKEKKPSPQNVKKEKTRLLGTQVDDLPLPSRHIDRFATLVADDRIRQCEKILLKAAGLTILLWLGLTALAFYVCPAESMERLHGRELTAYSMLFSILLVTNVSRLLTLVFKDEGRPLSLKSGFVLASYSAQFISTVTGFMIAFMETPVLIDPITGQRVHLLRWAAWAPLAGLMTFMTEGIDMTLRESGVQEACIHATILFVGTLPGGIFPYVTNVQTWLCLFGFGVACLMDVYYRFFTRRNKYYNVQKGRSAEEILEYHQTRLGFRLLNTCFVMWSLVGVYLVTCAMVPFWLPEGHFLRDPFLPAMVECFVEVTSKIWYLMVISSAYELIFDEAARTSRRLEELRAMMLAVWEKSSDMVVISTRSRDDADRAVSMVNPAFTRVSSGNSGDSSLGDSNNNALVFETPLLNNPAMVQKSVLQTRTTNAPDVFCIDLSEPITTNGANTHSQAWRTCQSQVSQRSVQSLVDVLITAWHSPAQESIIACDFVLEDGTVAKCEAKVTRLESNTVMVVICDITERVRRFEAEKVAVAAETARKKDAEANRFTKHEVKNGLLAAIGLCESLTSNAAAATSSTTTVTELENTLNEVLDTVLSETMARDVVHEVYEPVLECIYLPEILNSSTRSDDTRFSLKLGTQPFPQFLLDPKLLKYVHRNSVSNACKYGERCGEVVTELWYMEEEKEVVIKVINRPGSDHERLRKLDQKAIREVFLPGKSLHSALSTSKKDHVDRRYVSHSNGDGAWIMKKCAKIMKGDCDIAFEEDRTVFMFKCPAVPFRPASLPDVIRLNADFTVPPGTWGVAIDDSRIQRKLMNVFFGALGIDADHRRIIGADENEILNYGRFVQQLVREHPEDKVLIIADENLDIEGRSRTVSGSICTQQILEDLGSDRDRVLALVRSANDSKEDVDLYKSRTHGFLPKSQLRKDTVKKLIQPFWEERFERDELGKTEVVAMPAISSDSESGLVETQTYDIMRTVDAIDALLDAPNKESMEMRWPSIWEKLHLLKGDLLVIFGSQRSETVCVAISNLRSETTPYGLEGRWALIRSLVVSLL